MFDVIPCKFGDIAEGGIFVACGSFFRKCYNGADAGFPVYTTVAADKITRKFDVFDIVGKVALDAKEISTGFKVGDTCYKVNYRDEPVEVACKHCKGKGGRCNYCSNGKHKTYYSYGEISTAIVVEVIQTTNTTGTSTTYTVIYGGNSRTCKEFINGSFKSLANVIFKDKDLCEQSIEIDNKQEREKAIKDYYQYGDE